MKSSWSKGDSNEFEIGRSGRSVMIIDFKSVVDFQPRIEMEMAWIYSSGEELKSKGAKGKLQTNGYFVPIFWKWILF